MVWQPWGSRWAIRMSRMPWKAVKALMLQQTVMEKRAGRGMGCLAREAALPGA